jgi:hypothetical protein
MALIKLDVYVNSDIRENVELPEFKGKEREADEPVSIYQGVAYTGLESLDRDLKAGLEKLGEVVRKYGLVQGRMPEMVVKPYISLLLVRHLPCLALLTNRNDSQALAEVNLWQKATMDGKHKAKNGSIKESILRNIMQKATRRYLPSVNNSWSSQQIAKL